MKFEYDKEIDAAYIFLEDSINDKEAAKTIEANDNIILDFDKNGKLLGIEILSASKILNKKSLLGAELSKLFNP